MSLTPAMIDAMLTAGCTAEQIAAVVKADLAERDGQLATKREKDAERQRRHRASRDVTVTECDSVTDPLSRPPNENNSNPPTHTPGIQTRARKGHRLPVDWVPDLVSGELAKKTDGWPPGAMDSELERFRDWAASATGQNALKTDWQAAWRNWLRRADDDGRHRNGPRTQTNRTTGSASPDRRSSLARAIDEGLDWLDSAQAGVS